MLQFLLAIPEVFLYGWAILIAVAIAMSIALFRQIQLAAPQGSRDHATSSNGRSLTWMRSTGVS
jgi:hypothetical protein